MSSSSTLLVLRSSNTLPGAGALRRLKLGEEAAKDLTDTLQVRETDRCLGNRRHRAKDDAIWDFLQILIICHNSDSGGLCQPCTHKISTRPVFKFTQAITMVVCTNHPPWINIHTQISVQRLQLSIKAELENIASLEPAAEDFEFYFRVWNLFLFYSVFKSPCRYR